MWCTYFFLFIYLKYPIFRDNMLIKWLTIFNNIYSHQKKRLKNLRFL